jgi:hypothetical protein
MQSGSDPGTAPQPDIRAQIVALRETFPRHSRQRLPACLRLRRRRPIATSWPRSSASAAPESPPWLARSMELLPWPAVSLRSAGRRPGPARGRGELYFRGRSPAPSAALVADGGQPGLTAPASPSLVMPGPVAITAVQAVRS